MHYKKFKKSLMQKNILNLFKKKFNKNILKIAKEHKTTD
jgi:hypothetical protein